MKNFNDTIGNRTRDLPACSAALQPTAPPRAPLYYNTLCIIVHYIITLTVCSKLQTTKHDNKHQKAHRPVRNILEIHIQVQ